MRELKSFIELYNLCNQILKQQNAVFLNYTKSEKINFIRINNDKNTLNTYFKVGNISQKLSKSINSETTIIKFSADSLIKNIIEHPELSIEEYEKISEYLNNAEYILKKNNKNLIYFKINNKIYQFVIKQTKNGKELYITTFHIANINQLQKDILRYKNIKKDSSDYEDSNYPSVT